MLKNRLFNVFIAFVLLMVVALTVREAFATTNVVSHAGPTMDAARLECDSLPSRSSIHMQRIQATGTQLTYTEAGPTGVDGGLIYLLSAYRTCRDKER
jgi:hypothetical protein